MKHLLTIFAVLVLAASVAGAQTRVAVKTENANNQYKFYSAAATDTLISSTAMSAGSYIVGLAVGTPVDADSIYILNGAGTVFYAVIDNAANDIRPYFVPLGVRVDTSLIYVQKKTSKVTLIYRTNP